MFSITVNYLSVNLSFGDTCCPLSAAYSIVQVTSQSYGASRNFSALDDVLLRFRDIGLFNHCWRN